MTAPPYPALPYFALPRWGRALGDWLQICVAHFSTLIFLRWKLRRNQWNKESILGRVITIVFLVSVVSGGVMLLGAGVAAGFFVHRMEIRVGPSIFWSATLAGFSLVWLIHFSSELFRADGLTLDRIMHLPIAPSHAFAMNYFGSLLNVPIVYFVSFVTGAIVGSAVSVGPRMLLLAIPLVAYVALVTSLTSHFQMVLAAWIADPRRRRVAMLLVSLFFMIVFPALAIGLPRWIKAERRPEPPVEPVASVTYDQQPNERSNVDMEDSVPTTDASDGTEDPKSRPRRDRAQALSEILPTLKWVEVITPPLWLSACAKSLLDRDGIALAITPIMILLSCLSLRSNYRTTLRYYRQGFSGRLFSSRRNQRDTSNHVSTSDRSGALESFVPWLGPTTWAVVTQTWISVWRAPELKLMLLAPVAQPFVGLFLIRMWNISDNEFLRTAITLGLAGFALYTSCGVLGNQFGLDRAGFRAWVLAPIERQEILHGRNLAYGLPAWFAAAGMCLTVGWWWDLPAERLVFLLLALTAFLPFYLLVCNLMAILSPFALAPNGLEPKNLSWKHLVINLLLSFLLPPLLAWCSLPLAIELGLEWLLPVLKPWPIACVLSILWVYLSTLVYRWSLPAVGRLMAQRELEILKTVTSTIE